MVKTGRWKVATEEDLAAWKDRQARILAAAKPKAKVEADSAPAFVGFSSPAAEAKLDGVSGCLQRAILQQSWRDAWPSFSQVGILRLHPVLSVASVVYTGSDGSEHTLAAADFYVNEEAKGARLCFTDSAPVSASLANRPDAVRCVYVAGYGEQVASVPARLRQAHRLIVGHAYENREAVAHVASGRFETLPMGVDSLLAPFRRFGVEAWAKEAKKEIGYGRKF